MTGTQTRKNKEMHGVYESQSGQSSSVKPAHTFWIILANTKCVSDHAKLSWATQSDGVYSVMIRTVPRMQTFIHPVNPGRDK